MHAPGIFDILAVLAVGAIVVSLWRGMRALESIAAALKEPANRAESHTPPQG